ncbi:MAG: hypothetical protein WAL59_05400 [Roseiarcus sp.]
MAVASMMRVLPTQGIISGFSTGAGNLRKSGPLAPTHPIPSGLLIRRKKMINNRVMSRLPTKPFASLDRPRGAAPQIQGTSSAQAFEVGARP